MRSNCDWLILFFIASRICGIEGWVPAQQNTEFGGITRTTKRKLTLTALPNDEAQGFEETDAATKTVVSSLTGLINILAPRQQALEEEGLDPNRQWRSQSMQPPRSPSELMDRIASDYTVHNYLWTGNIDLSAFDAQCRFRDPTLSFIGTEQFVRNIRNLRPIVDALTLPKACRSELLSIRLDTDQGFVQSRWNMIGDIGKLPWKPRIDVIGRTKFWYQLQQDNSYQVVSYDEEWEIPASLALLQLITPAGMISNTLSK